MATKFEAGINIAIKIPKSKYEKTVAFYRDILKLECKEAAGSKHQQHIFNWTDSR